MLTRNVTEDGIAGGWSQPLRQVGLLPDGCDGAVASYGRSSDSARSGYMETASNASRRDLRLGEDGLRVQRRWSRVTEVSLDFTLKRGEKDDEGSMRAQILTTDMTLAIAMQKDGTNGGVAAMGG